MWPLLRRVDQFRLDWVHANVLHLALKVARVPDRLLMKTGLPYFHSVFPPLVDFIRAAAFDELHHLFQGCDWSRREQKMHMVGHEDEFVKEVSAGGSMAQQDLDHYFSGLCHLKQTTIGPGFRGHKVSATRTCPMLQSAHFLQGLKPIFLFTWHVGPEGPTPPNSCGTHMPSPLVSPLAKLIIDQIQFSKLIDVHP